MLVQAQQSAVGNRHPMRIARQIRQYRFRSGKRAFGVDHPFALALGRQPLGEVLRVDQLRGVAEELQLAGAMCLVEFFQKASSKQARQHPYRQKEARLAGDPALAID